MYSEKISKTQRGVLSVFQTRSQTKAYYNKISKVYDLLAYRSEAPTRKAGLEKLAAQPGEKILEVGFGTGHCLVELAQPVGHAGRVYGVDLSEEMLKVSEERLKKEDLEHRAELVCGDATNLPYKDSMMDAVFMSFTLEVFDTPEIPKVLNGCKRILKPEGRIVVVGTSKEGTEDFRVKAYEWTHNHFPNLVNCRPIYVGRALQDAGLKVEDATMMQVWLPVEIVLATKE